MYYIYPKLSEKDCLIFRLGGAGLGNILFTYARAVVYTKKHKNARMIWPTWFSLKLGPILRRESDKRFYNDLFVNKSEYISGLKKAYFLLTKKHIKEQEISKNQKSDDCIVEFEGFENCFEEIINDSNIVYEDIVRNLNPKYKAALSFDGKNSICMHVRLGDFARVSWEEVKSGKHCSAIPIEWYVCMGMTLRQIIGEKTKIYVFSDGTDEELKPLLQLENVERITFGSAIADILALSNSGIFVASGSSFSMWARYLGRMTAVMFPNQVKQKILQSYDQGKEIVAFDKISLEDAQFIKKYWNQKESSELVNRDSF